MADVPDLPSIPDTLMSEAFWDMFGRIEHERLDWKVRADGLGDTIPAMAMTDGGLIVLGISNKHDLVGCEMTQAVFDRVMVAAHDACDVPVVLKPIAVEQIPLTIVAVPEVRGRIVTTSDGRLLRRQGSSSRPLVGEALARFVLERSMRSRLMGASRVKAGERIAGRGIPVPRPWHGTSEAQAVNGRNLRGRRPATMSGVSGQRSCH